MDQPAQHVSAADPRAGRRGSCLRRANRSGKRERAGRPLRGIATELQRLHLVTLQGAAGDVQQTTQLTEPQRAILAALDVEPPPRITALEPA